MGRAVTCVTEHALHQEARVVGAAAAAAAVLAGVRTHQTVAAGALKGPGGRKSQTSPAPARGGILGGGQGSEHQGRGLGTRV